LDRKNNGFRIFLVSPTLAERSVAAGRTDSAPASTSSARVTCGVLGTNGGTRARQAISIPCRCPLRGSCTADCGHSLQVPSLLAAYRDRHGSPEDAQTGCERLHLPQKELLRSASGQHEPWKWGRACSAASVLFQNVQKEATSLLAEAGFRSCARQRFALIGQEKRHHSSKHRSVNTYLRGHCCSLQSQIRE
jgi:L-lactate utilization protein LutB